MRLIRRNWLAGLAAVAALTSVVVPGQAKDLAETVEIGNFAGAYLAARVAESDDDLAASIEYYSRALTFDPDNKTLQQSLMLALISSGRFDEAIPYAEKLKAEPEVERFSRLALAVGAFRKKEYSKAEDWLRLALESDLDRLISSLMTAWAKAGAGDVNDALSYLESIEGPEWYTLFTGYHRALIADGAGLAGQAEAAYAETVANTASGSGAPDAWIRAAEAYTSFLVRQGEKAKAIAILDQADQFSLGRPQIAALREAVNKGMPIPPLVAGPTEGGTEVLLNIGTALNRGGSEAFVRLYLQYALALKPDSDVVLMQLAGIAEQAQDAEEAIDYYHRVSDKSPLKRLAELQLGLNLADLDRHDEAIKHLSVLLDANADDMRAYLALGGVYAAKEDYRGAADVYDRAVARLPKPTNENWNIFYQRGIAYERLKEWQKAEPNFRKALELYPNQPQVMNYLGYSWVDMNMNLEEGLDMIRKAVDLRPSDGYIVDSLGWAYYRLNKFEDAVRELERAVSLKPDDPVLNDHLGDAYWRVGRKLEATFQWNHARDMKPEPDVLATVQKKLVEGLPPLEGKAAEKAEAPVTPPQAKEPAADPGKKSETPADVETTEAVPAAYKVMRGQSLWSIAVDQLGNGGRYREILDLNPQLRGDPGMLRPGQELRLPAGN